METPGAKVQFCCYIGCYSASANAVFHVYSLFTLGQECPIPRIPPWIPVPWIPPQQPANFRSHGTRPTVCWLPAPKENPAQGRGWWWGCATYAVSSASIQPPTGGARAKATVQTRPRARCPVETLPRQRYSGKLTLPALPAESTQAVGIPMAPWSRALGHRLVCTAVGQHTSRCPKTGAPRHASRQVELPRCRGSAPGRGPKETRPRAGLCVGCSMAKKVSSHCNPCPGIFPRNPPPL